MLDKALVAAPHSLPTILAKAQVLTVQGKFKESLEISDSVITNATSLLANAYFNKSAVHFAMQNYEEALNCSTRAISLDTSGKVLCTHAMALFANGKTKEALKTHPSLPPLLPFSLFRPRCSPMRFFNKLAVHFAIQNF